MPKNQDPTFEETTIEVVVAPKASLFKQKAFLVGTAVGVAFTSVAVAVLARKSGRVEIEVESDNAPDELTNG